MPAGDLFKRTLDAGTSFIDLTRERAEVVVKEWVDAGDVRTAKAQKAIDDLLARSRRVSEDLREMIRREVREQVSTLGFATKDDVARLEAKVDQELHTPGKAPEAAAKPRATKSAAVKKSAPLKQSAPARKAAPAKKSAAKKSPPARNPTGEA
jgi:polyhydroxyalkanoate synthesis regulator phasin